MTRMTRRVLLLGVSLVGLGLPAALAAASASAIVPTGCTITGTVQVTDTDNNTVLGYVSNVWNSYGESVVTTTPADYLSVSVPSGNAVNITALNGPNSSYPEVGGIQGFANTSPDLGSGSFNYAYLGGTTETASGATPTSGANSFTAATGVPEDFESAIWSVGAGGSLTPQWVNTDSSEPATHLVDINDILVLTGDTTAFEGTFGAAADVALNVVPTSSTCTPSLTTTPNPTSVGLGSTPTTLQDTAVLSGGSVPTGTITFTLYLGATPVHTETVTVSGDGSYTTSTGYTLPSTGTVTGTYQWDASYSGDTVNAGATDNNATNEQVVVSGASPSLSTTPNPASVTVGVPPVTLQDTAALAGGAYPTGTITFTLDKGATVLHTETVTVSGNGSYTTSTGYTLSSPTAVAGTYQWDATYSGDTNNKGVSDNGATNEQVTVTTLCATGLTPYVLTATSRTGNFTGLFCVNASGNGTYAQAGGPSGTGTVETLNGTTRITAFGTDLALIGQKNSFSNAFTEMAPSPEKAGTFTLT
jgi:hypothetical protein